MLQDGQQLADQGLPWYEVGDCSQPLLQQACIISYLPLPLMLLMLLLLPMQWLLLLLLLLLLLGRQRLPLLLWHQRWFPSSGPDRRPC
jgi:hypothetical protein